MNTANVMGWSTTGYNFVSFSNTGTSTGALVPEYNQHLTLWGVLPNGTRASG